MTHSHDQTLPPPLAADAALSRRVLALTAISICALYALLWSPWWYPLSDSALYLNMARALARGEGWEHARQLHRDVRPLTPLLLAGIMKLGGGIGAMHAVMITLTLLSHALAFLTLRRWFNARTALAAVTATAASWWVYANAFTIMTEPPFLLFFWAAMYLLRDVPGQMMTPVTWTRIAAAAIFLGLAFETRIAAIFTLAAIGLALWMREARKGWKIHLQWTALFLFVVVLGALMAKWLDRAGPREAGEAYKLHLLVGVRHPLVDLPVSAGRWVVEVLAAPFAALFDLKSTPVRLLAAIASVGIFAVACLGWWWLLRTRRWYPAALAAANFLPFVVLWGTRLKPRYMAPIAPVLFIQFWAGLATLLGGRWRNAIGGVLLTGIIAVNLPPYLVELYVRRGTRQNFYDVARHGGYAELVDIGHYVQHHAQHDAPVWVNWPPPSSRPPDAVFAPDKRIVQFLTDRDVQFIPVGGRDGHVYDSGDRAGLQQFFSHVLGDWAIVYYDRLPWPSFHVSLARTSPLPDTGPRWWQLFHRDHTSGRFEPVDPPRQRDYVRTIPGWEQE